MRTFAWGRSSQKTVLPLWVNDFRYAKAHGHRVFPTSNRYNSESADGFQDVGPAHTRTLNRGCKSLNAVENRTLAIPANEMCFCVDICMTNVFKAFAFSPVIIQSIGETLHTCRIKRMQFLPEPQRNLTQMVVNCSTPGWIPRTSDPFLNQLPKRMLTPREQTRRQYAVQCWAKCAK